MLHVALCDDEASSLHALEVSITRWMEATKHTDVQLSAFSSSEDLLYRWQRGMPIDLLFIDIQIPGELNGLALARRMREHDTHMFIVFVTYYANYAFDGYTVQALRYLQKPFNESELFSCLDYVSRQIHTLREQQLVLHTPNARIVLPYMDLRYVEARLHYLFFFLENRNHEFLRLRATLEEFCTQLPTPPFIRCHRSYIVNLAYIRRFTQSSLLLIGKTDVSLPVSRTYYHALDAAFSRYYGEEI